MLIQPELDNHNYFYKMIHLYMGMIITTFTYYAAFCVIEANLIACGFGYSVSENTENFNSVRMISITPILLATSFADYGTNWNIQIHNWLKYYVMLRLMDRSKAKGAPQLFATFMTFIVSSVWHGIFLGFIVFFIAIALLEIQSKGFPRLKFT